MLFLIETPPTELYTLSLHDALPISETGWRQAISQIAAHRRENHLARVMASLQRIHRANRQDRKSTRLNSSHSQISYAVFCLKKKKILRTPHIAPAHRP